jgi:hypothetical protein
MKLVLHIGTEKTGSTSFQHWARINRDRLAAQGIWANQPFGSLNHQMLHCWALGEHSDDDAMARLGLTDAAIYDEFHAGFAGVFAAEVAAARAAGLTTMLISTEYGHSRLVRPEQVARLEQLFDGLFDDIEIICCLRPQIDLALSHMSTVARIEFDLPADYLECVTPANPYFDYAGLVARWSAVFGAGNLRLLAYRRHPDILSRLIDLLGVDSTGFALPERVNSALDIRTIAMIKAVFGPMARRGFPPLAPIRRNLDRIACSEPISPGSDIARKVQARFDADNAALEAARPDLGPGDLSPDRARHDRPPNLHLLDQDCAFSDQIAELLIAMQTDQNLTTARLQLTLAAQALAKGNRQNAAEQLQNYRNTAALVPGDFDPESIARMNQRADGIANKLAAGAKGRRP